MVDPLADLHIQVESFDVPREATVYGSNAGNLWWTKAWFNNNEKGEKAVYISREQAILFNNRRVDKDNWLSRYFPAQMANYKNAMFNTRRQLLGL